MREQLVKRSASLTDYRRQRTAEEVLGVEYEVQGELADNDKLLTNVLHEVKKSFSKTKLKVDSPRLYERGDGDLDRTWESLDQASQQLFDAIESQRRIPDKGA